MTTRSTLATKICGAYRYLDAVLVFNKSCRSADEGDKLATRSYSFVNFGEFREH